MYTHIGIEQPREIEQLMKINFIDSVLVVHCKTAIWLIALKGGKKRGEMERIQIITGCINSVLGDRECLELASKPGGVLAIRESIENIFIKYLDWLARYNTGIQLILELRKQKDKSKRLFQYPVHITFTEPRTTCYCLPTRTEIQQSILAPQDSPSQYSKFHTVREHNFIYSRLSYPHYVCLLS